MQPFDQSTYLKRVLQPLKGEKPDPFARYLLDLTDDDTDAIRARMVEVKSYWNNTSTAGGAVGRVIKSMLREQSICEAQLLDASERHALRDQLVAQRASAQAAKWTNVDRALEQANKAHGGIPDEVLVRIVDIGKQAGLTEAEVQAHVAEVMTAKNWKTVELAQVSDIEPLPDARARQIEQAVRVFGDAQQHVTGNSSPVRSLFEALDLQMDAGVSVCAAAIADLDRRLNTQIAAASDLGSAGRTILQLARANLGSDATINTYRATLVHGVRAQLWPEFDSMAIDGAIDQQENAELLQRAAEAGLPDVYAREVINLLFRDFAATGRTVTRIEGERVEIILCAACGSPDAIGSGHSQCLKCAQPLYRACESCHQDVPRGEAVCRYCGQSMQAAIRLDAELRDGRQALASGRPDQAAKNASAALAMAPGSTEAKQLAADSQAAISRAQAMWRVVREALSERRLYAARAALQGLAVEGSDVRDGSHYPADVQAQINSDLEVVDERLTRARGESDPSRREQLLAEVLSQAVDCEPAQRALSQIPPQPASHVEANIVGSEVQLHWAPSPSPGISGYVVVRGLQRAPVDIGHGERVGASVSTTQTDSSVSPGTTVAYAVFAQRAGTSSAPATTQPLLAAFEARDVQATVGSGEVRLSWTVPAQQASVVVERVANGQQTTLHAGGDGLVDSNLLNGQLYSYTVRVRYGTELTAGVTVTATPAEPPRAVALQGLEAVAGGVKISWTPAPAGDVTVIRSPKPLELAAGTEVRRADLTALGSLLPGDRGSATDPGAVDGWYYTPATVVGDRAVVGSGLRWTDIAAITDLRIRATADGAALSWNWPPDVRHAVVVWREGGNPGGPADPDSQHANVSRVAQQEVSGGVFTISRGRPAEPLRVAVYGAQMRDGELVVGSRLVPSSRASLDPTLERETISYDVRIKGSMRKALEFQLSGAQSFPEVVLVVRAGDVMLLDRDAGQPVARLGGNGGPAEIAVPLGALPKDRPLSVRAFLAADSSQARFSLRDPADLTKLTLR